MAPFEAKETHEATPALHPWVTLRVRPLKEIADLANALAKQTGRRLKAFHGHHHELVDYNTKSDLMLIQLVLEVLPC